MFMGTDPGYSGATVIINQDRKLIDYCRHNKTESELHTMLNAYGRIISFACLESVHSMPRQGVSSTFKFGKQFGTCIGLLTAEKIRFQLVLPRVWQRELNCLTGGNKNITKKKAAELFPGQKIIHATADAFLLAEYARRQWNQLSDRSKKIRN